MIYNYFVSNPLLAIIFLLFVVAIAVFLFVKAMQKIGLKKIQLYAYRWFEEAEYKFNHGDNTQKFDYVIQLARSSIPSPFNTFITEKLLRKVIQIWFNLCKDLLDDGKLNNTVNKKE